jgi:exodeoxyribonuclease III
VPRLCAFQDPPSGRRFAADAPNPRLDRWARTTPTPRPQSGGSRIDPLFAAVADAFSGAESVVMSPRMKLVSWNVNGLRSILRKNFLEYLDDEKPDVLCLQETKCNPDEIEQLWPVAYATYWCPAQKKGYSGIALFTRTRPLKVTPHIGVAEHDLEGRVLAAEFADFFLVNVYVPNSKRDLSRLPYRKQWDRAFLGYLKKLQRAKPVIFCGDLNVAHTELDLAHPRANVGNHGFTPQERAGFDAFLKAGFIDTFREFQKDGGHYTWWSVMTGARARNIGWRLDYFLISASLRPRLKGAFIRSKVEGSDHCPVGIEIA